MSTSENINSIRQEIVKFIELQLTADFIQLKKESLYDNIITAIKNSDYSLHNLLNLELPKISNSIISAKEPKFHHQKKKISNCLLNL